MQNNEKPKISVLTFYLPSKIIQNKCTKSNLIFATLAACIFYIFFLILGNISTILYCASTLLKTYRTVINTKL